MSDRPELKKGLDSNTFRSYYYLKEELLGFCRENGLPVSGSKIQLTDRIAHFLDTGEVLLPAAESRKRSAADSAPISMDGKIGENFVCSEVHRAFFKEHLGKSFSFNVGFQKWLKTNVGKTYADAIEAYRLIIEEKKHSKTTIDSQFEYNTYIRDFFADNKGRSLGDAIKCWKYKKSLKGHNRYEPSDLTALDKE